MSNPSGRNADATSPTPNGYFFVSPATAKTHVGWILTKLGVRDWAQLVMLAYETGLVTPGTP